LSENEWEGWQHDIIRQWTSIAEEPELDYSPIRFSDHHHTDDDSSPARRRIYSDVDQSLFQRSPLTMTDLSALSDRGYPPQFSPTVWMPGSVISSTVSVGRSSGRRRSSTVTASSSSSPTPRETKTKSVENKEKTEKQKEPLLRRNRPPSLQIQPPVPKPQEEPDSLSRNGTAKRRSRSRPTSALPRHNAVDFDLPTSPTPSQVAQPERSVSPNDATSIEGPHGGDPVRTKSKVPSLNGIVRGVSIAVRSKTRGML
jgi:hypothetical protein